MWPERGAGRTGTGMKPALRRDSIVRLLEDLGEVTVEELAVRFGASRETIRRDLTELDAGGRLRKFHGGARRHMASDAGLTESGFDARLVERTAEKTRIGRAAAGLFSDGAVMFIDTGSTTIAFARALADGPRGLTAITNSPQIARHLARAETRNHVYLVGGEVAAEGRETLGLLATSQIGQFAAEHVVLTVGAVGPAGIMDYDLRETEMARAMIARAARVTVLADHSKLGRSAVFEVAPLSRIARLVTDRAPAPEMAAALARAGVEIVLAGPAAG